MCHLCSAGARCLFREGRECTPLSGGGNAAVLASKGALRRAPLSLPERACRSGRISLLVSEAQVLLRRLQTLFS